MTEIIRSAVDVQPRMLLQKRWFRFLSWFCFKTSLYCLHHIDFCCCFLLKPLWSIKKAQLHMEEEDSGVFPASGCWCFLFVSNNKWHLIFNARFTFSAQLFSYYVCVAHIPKQHTLFFVLILLNACIWALALAREAGESHMFASPSTSSHSQDSLYRFFFFPPSAHFCELPAMLYFSSSQVWGNRLLWNYTSPLTKLERCQWQLCGIG